MAKKSRQSNNPERKKADRFFEIRNPVNPVFGERVREAINASGKKQSEIAKEIGIDARYLSMIVCGKRGLSRKMAEKIANACGNGIRSNYLLDSTDYPTDEAEQKAIIKEQIAKDSALALQKNHKISRYLTTLNLLKEAKFKVDLITDSGPVEYDGDSLVFYELFRHPTGEVFIIESPDGIKKTVGFEEFFNLVKSLDRYVVSAVSQFAGFAFVHMREEEGYTNG